MLPQLDGSRLITLEIRIRCADPQSLPLRSFSLFETSQFKFSLSLGNQKHQERFPLLHNGSPHLPFRSLPCFRNHQRSRPPPNSKPILWRLRASRHARRWSSSRLSLWNLDLQQPSLHLLLPKFHILWAVSTWSLLLSHV